MKNYVSYPGTQYGPPPYSFPGMTITSFVLPAGLIELQGYCDDYLNIGQQYEFTAIGPYIILGINTYPKMVSESVQDLGFTSQNEYYFMFPVLRTMSTWGSFLSLGKAAPEITWVFPYIGVDNATSAFCGRELLGFQKMVGQIEVDTDGQGRFFATVQMPGFPKASSNTAQQSLPLLAINTGLPKPPQAGLTFPWDLWSSAIDLGQILPAAKPLLAALDQYSVTNLKQFDDPADPKSAIYQALVRMVFQLNDKQPMTLFDGATIKLTDNPSMLIANTLGLQPNAGGELEALAASRMTTDMRLDNVDTL